MLRRLGIMIAVGSLYAADSGRTRNDLIGLVRSSISERQDDRQFSKTLHKFKLRERLEERVLEELESEGAGRATIAELEHLRETSQALPRSSEELPFRSPAVPAEAEWSQVLEDARANALHYSASLPNFMCTQEVRRYTATKGFWQLQDTLTLKLSFFGQQEDYKLIALNGRPTAISYQAVGGAITQGEFGSMLRSIFEAASHTHFQWDHWTTLRKRPALVFAFSVRAANGRYVVEFANGRSSRRSTITGQEGFVYVDRDTHMVVRIVNNASEIPREFPVHTADTLLDYDFQDVGGQEFILPLRARISMASRDYRTKNEMEFRAFRKFAAETTITFDAVKDEKTKDK